ncbi:hypothetical protein D3C87_1957550 [compost metagenome]
MRTIVGDDDMRTEARSRRVPEAAVEFLMGYYHAARAGEFAPVDGALAAILGRAPETMRSHLTKALQGGGGRAVNVV